jgi:hypothetical protein
MFPLRPAKCCRLYDRHQPLTDKGIESLLRFPDVHHMGVALRTKGRRMKDAPGQVLFLPADLPPQRFMLLAQIFVGRSAGTALRNLRPQSGKSTPFVPRYGV